MVPVEAPYVQLAANTLNILQLFSTVLNSSIRQYIEYQDAHAMLFTESTVTLNYLQFYSCWEKIVYMIICSPCVLLVLCIFVVLVDFQFRLEGKILVIITPVPDHCYFFSYSQTLFANLFLYI